MHENVLSLHVISAWNDFTPWGVLQVAVRCIIRLVHRRIRTGKDIYRTGCFLFSVSVRVAERHHQCTTLAATLRGKWIGLPKILFFGKSGAHPSTPTKTQFWYMYEDSVREAEADQPHTNCKWSLTYWLRPNGRIWNHKPINHKPTQPPINS